MVPGRELDEVRACRATLRRVCELTRACTAHPTARTAQSATRRLCPS
jgi:hypothetical protein